MLKPMNCKIYLHFSLSEIVSLNRMVDPRKSLFEATTVKLFYDS